jgi:hypothetical protein
MRGLKGSELQRIESSELQRISAIVHTNGHGLEPTGPRVRAYWSRVQASCSQVQAYLNVCVVFFFFIILVLHLVMGIKKTGPQGPGTVS